MPQTQYTNAQYTYDVVVPADPKPDTKYKYAYEVQVPVTKSESDYLQGLYTQVDRVALPKPNCGAPNGCTCHYNPSICAVHSVLDSGEDNAHAIRFEVNSNAPVIRTRRGLKDALDGLKSKRQITLTDLNERLNEKIVEFSSKKDEIINKIKEKRSQRPIATWADNARQEFIRNVRANFDGLTRSRRDADKTVESQAAGSALNGQTAEAKSQQVRKHNFFCPTIESLKGSQTMRQRPEALQFMPEIEQQPSNARTRKHCQECGSVSNEAICRACNSEKNYHPAQSRYYEYIEGQPISYIPGLQQQQEQPQVGQQKHQSDNDRAVPQARYIYDRYGHRYMESKNGNLKLMPTVQLQTEPAQSQSDALVGAPNMAALNRILAHNQEFIHATNSNEPGQLIDRPIVVVRDGIRFIQDILHNPNPLRADPNGRSDGNDDDSDESIVGSTAHDLRWKKDVNKDMFRIVPVMANDNDGSLLVKIYPKQKNEKVEKSVKDRLANDEYVTVNRAVNHAKSMQSQDHESVNAENVSETQTIGTKTVRKMPQATKTSTTMTNDDKNSKQKYEILTIDGNFTPVDTNEEVDHILKFIYDEQEKQIDNEIEKGMIDSDAKQK